ncbi:hypothetical protein BDV27DRAFT_121410 [Aspergillus caelatus]|uniref:Uncharacterized protein n=1 Tax=Aspergillus caelatus TaxID=61420 RepID=A0A5N7AJE3_9EURO|nr:uncharacterized protein BDV27DRAFT_121410 [Aspergillus caelatus]KAE8369129.1 hypothetical protein BDV27DRAFT_121410 [Aspergillus caelatus]
MSQHGISFDSVLEGGDGVAILEHDRGGSGTDAEGNAQNHKSQEHGKRSRWFPYYKEVRSWSGSLILILLHCQTGVSI